jgi:hypothetical protein
MNKSVNVGIHIIPDHTLETNMDKILEGRSLSTLDELLVNKVGDDYSIIYNDEVFASLDIHSFVENLSGIFNSNLPGVTIDVMIYYWYYNTPELFSDECGKAILEMSDYLGDCHHSNIAYEISQVVDHLYQCYDQESDEFDFTDYDDDCEDPDDEECEEGDELASALDEYFDIESAKSKKMKSSYGSSRVLKSSKNPKKSYKRHGLIVSNNKSAKKKDEKMIRSFLKDFLPGKESWKKDFREELLKRWMKTYAISKKVLGKLEKQHRSQRQKGSKGNKITKQNAMNFTRKLLLTSGDSWNDPNR